MEMKQLSRIIGVIGRQKVRIDNMIQVAAVQVIAQSIVNRNSTPADQLFSAVGVSSRRDALLKFYEMFGNLTWSKGEKRVIFCDMEVTDNRKLEWTDEYATKVSEFIWHKAKPEPKQVSMYDVEEKVSALIDSLRKAAKKGITLQNVELLDGVESLYVKFVAETFAAKEMAATPALEGDDLKAASDAAKDAAAADTTPMSDREALAVQMKDGVQLAA
jgi:hypothetical protein